MLRKTTLITSGLLLVGLVGCTPGVASMRSLPAALRLPPSGGLHLVGEIRGPLTGLGMSVALDAWLRHDGWLRAEMRYELPDGRAAHDVLIWTPDVAMVVDRVRGGITLLGETPGELEAEGTTFRLAHAVWLSLGRAVPEAWTDTWDRKNDEWRGRIAGFGLRCELDDDGRWKWTEIAWPTADGEVQSLRAYPEKTEVTEWGPVVTRLAVDGPALEARVVVEWTPEVVEFIDDATFDPLWR